MIIEKCKRTICPACGLNQPTEASRIWCKSCGLAWEPVIGDSYPHHSIPLDHYEGEPSIEFDKTEPKIARNIKGDSLHFWDSRIKAALKHTSKRDMFLEIGFGGTDILDFVVASKEWKRIAGIELCGMYVACARSKGYEAYWRDVSLEPKPLDTLAGACNLIVINEVMEHVRYPVDFLTGARKYLAPDGVLWVSFAMYEGREKLSKGESQYWTKKAIETVAKKAGLTIIETEQSYQTLLVSFK